MKAIEASSLEVQGIGVIEDAFKDQPKAVLLTNGQVNYVVVTQDHHQYLKQCEIQAALAASRLDIANGRFVKETVADHVSRLKRL